METTVEGEVRILVLQGGGALGAYQAGAFEALDASGQEPHWVAGISIGAINAALIAGNRPADRVAKLNAFWERVTSRIDPFSVPGFAVTRRFSAEAAATAAAAGGVPGFFSLRPLPAWFAPNGTAGALSIYDTTPLADTLAEFVDFNLLNDLGPRLSVGAVDVTSGNFTYFDSTETVIAPEHIMASGALPPGFPPISIDGNSYWDGGVVSNTPLEFVMEQATGTAPRCIFQIDLFSARGVMPASIDEVAQRAKDIRYSSRTRLTTDRYCQLHAIGLAARRLAARLPERAQADPDLALLKAVGGQAPVTLVHLIHRAQAYESRSKDYEFSRLSMREHWAAGKSDVERTLRHRSWRHRGLPENGIQVFDIRHRDE